MVRSSVRPSVWSLDSFSSLWAAFTLTVHINALYNESKNGKEEHATWINTIPLKISHLFGFPVSNRWSQRDSLACLRLDSRYNISLFDSNHFICDTSPLFCSHGNSFPYVRENARLVLNISQKSRTLQMIITRKQKYFSGRIPTIHIQIVI